MFCKKKVSNLFNFLKVFESSLLMDFRGKNVFNTDLADDINENLQLNFCGIKKMP